jgi:hypothetical protein
LRIDLSSWLETSLLWFGIAAAGRARASGAALRGGRQEITARPVRSR